MAYSGGGADQGIVARTLAAMRYAFTGTAPDSWFGPAEPLAPQAPASVRGRALDFPVAANINFRPRAGEATGFDRLKLLATNPIVAMLLQRQKDLLCGIEWRIKPRTVLDPDAAEDPTIEPITEFFHEPDGEHDWVQWISAVLDQLMVLDATSIYVRPTRGGGVYSCEILDGATIKPLINGLGRRPLSPEPAYQQVLKGLPAVDYTADELIYFPQTYRPDRIYGYSRVEQAADFIDQSIARLKSQKGYWTHGNLGDGYFEVPDNWTPDDIVMLEARWNQMMSGSVEGRRSSPFVPHGTVFHETKTNILADAYDEWLIRCLCFPFGVAPTPFMKQTGLGHGSAGTDKQAAEEGGIAPLMQFVTRLINRILRKHFNRPDLEFTWIEDRELDPKTAADIDDIQLKNGSKTINEVRDRNGDLPIEGGDKAMIYLPASVVLVEEASAPAADPADMPAAAPATGGSEAQPEAALGLAKADLKAQRRLARTVKGYLATKADEVAEAVSSRLGKAAMDDYQARIDAALDQIDWSWDDLPDVLGPLLAGMAVAAGTDALSDLGLFDSAVLKRMSARATDFANERAAELVGMKWIDGDLVPNPDAAWSIAETTRTMLRGTIAEAMETGASNERLASAIRESTAFSATRAETIARTETALASKAGNKEGWRSSGVVAGREWQSAPDCCDECQTYDGTIIGIDDEFPWGDEAHPQCRCTEIAVLPEDMPDAGTAKDDASTEDH